MMGHDRDTRTFPSLDIWTEIIRQFRFNLTDNDSVRKTKLATLRNLSLVSRQLSPLSQSEIWRTVSSAKHIARYITKVEGSNVVHGMQAKFLRKPLDAQCMAQVLRMLSYTRTFIFKAASVDEDLNWEFVLMATGRCPLFCNLRTIIVESEGFNHPSVRNTFSIIASSTIERVIYYSLSQGDVKSVLLLHSNLRIQNAPVTSVEVRVGTGIAISPCIASRLLYTAAPSISLNITRIHLDHRKREDLASWFLALSGSSNLTHFRIVITSPSGTRPSTKHILGQIFGFPKLERLEIHTTSGLQDLLSCLVCPSLVTLSLHLSSADRWPAVLASMVHFTRIEDLSIQFDEKGPIQALGLQDLDPVITSFILLRNLKLRGAVSRLAEGDIIYILTTRPSLRSLIVSGPKATLLPLSIFSSMKSTQLEIICLPIDLSGVASLLAPLVWPKISSVTQFIIWDGNMIPDSMREKLKIAEFIHRTFPHAKIGSLHEESEAKGRKSVEDLEELRYYFTRGFAGTNMVPS